MSMILVRLDAPEISRTALRRTTNAPATVAAIVVACITVIMPRRRSCSCRAWRAQRNRDALGGIEGA
jgi:hypothetical protein